MTKTEMHLRDTLETLSFALTRKTASITSHNLNELIEGNEFYLPDGGYSRIVVSLETGRARLTSNSLSSAKEAWLQSKELISDLETRLLLLRKEIDPTSEI